ncbi:shiftless antiviral inhibitor of ribosomal frameshifting protein homolog [Mytilus galloprovincialis]|uniref:shiftless antiviral inhibitor of ribosomal frameshifting protein homolog n=1 Tax=Mytilus galloprovincialis TaxID=29158 RepID=UPI003F7BA127
MDDIIYRRENDQAGPVPIIRTKIQSLREVLRGRFAYEEAERLINHHQGDVQATVHFALTAELQAIRKISRSDDEGWQIVRNEKAWKELAQQGQFKHEERQYACGPCDNVWWRKVPARKRVSKCKRCYVRYDAIPRNKEWGWAEFACNNCEHVFRGFGQMGNTRSPCFRCSTPCLPVNIFPRKKRKDTERIQRRARDNHSCFSHNCFRRAAGPQMPGICVHPKSLCRGQRAVFPSHSHHSTGSTIDTFLTQDDLFSRMSDFGPDVSDIDEDDGDDSN